MVRQFKSYSIAAKGLVLLKFLLEITKEASSRENMVGRTTKETLAKARSFKCTQDPRLLRQWRLGKSPKNRAAKGFLAQLCTAHLMPDSSVPPTTSEASFQRMINCGSDMTAPSQSSTKVVYDKSLWLYRLGITSCNSPRRIKNQPPAGWT